MVHLAPSLATLRRQIQARWTLPKDRPIGWIGDAAHAARKSEHNPDPDGTVDAIDVPHIPDIGLDMHRLTSELVASGDPRLQRIIWNRRSWNNVRRTWVPYNGANPHDRHAHIETTDAGQADGSDWRLPILGPAPAREPAQPTPVVTQPATPMEDDDMAQWLISDGTQVWLTNGVAKRPVTLPGDDLATVAERCKEIMFCGWARNTIKPDGVPDIPTNAAILAPIPAATPAAGIDTASIAAALHGLFPVSGTFKVGA